MCSDMQQGLQSNRCNGIEDSVFYLIGNSSVHQYVADISKDCEAIVATVAARQTFFHLASKRPSQEQHGKEKDL